MKLLSHYLNNTITVFFQTTNQYDLYLMLYYSFLFAATYALGSTFVAITSIRDFFGAFELFWFLVIATNAIVSSNHFYGIVKNVIRYGIAVILGSILSYVSLCIVGPILWPIGFIYFFIIAISGGFFMSSKLAPFYIFKFLYLVFYFLSFEDIFKTSFYQVRDHLLFSLGSFLSMASCIIACFLFRVPFANNLYIQTSVNILLRTRSYLDELKKQVNTIFSFKKEDRFYYKDIDEIGNNELIKLKGNLEKHYHEYSEKLNHLDETLSDSRCEYWAKHYIVHYERIQILFERNLKKLITVGLSLNNEISKDVSNEMAPILPYMNTLFDEIEFIFTQMEHQLKYQFIHSDKSGYCEWFKNQKASEYYKHLDEQDETSNQAAYNLNNFGFIYKIEEFDNGDSTQSHKYGSLEWNQLEINKSFIKIDQAIASIDELFETIYKDDVQLFQPQNQDGGNSISKIYVLVKAFITFCSEQKLLSKEVFLVSYHNSLNRNKPQEWLALVSQVKRFYKYISHKKTKEDQVKEKKEKEKEKEPWKVIAKRFVMDRMLYNWEFTLKYAFICSAGAVGVHEIKHHSHYQLFEMFNWVMNVIIVASEPEGAMFFLTVVRVITIIVGGFLGYSSVILAELGGNDAAKGLIYCWYSFAIIFTCGVLLNYQVFKNMITCIVFTYSTVSVPLYNDGTNIIFTLYRTFYVAFGFALLYFFALIVPYYENRILEKNLYKIPHAIIQIVDYILYYNFNSSSNPKLLSIPYNQTNEQYTFTNVDYGHNNNDNINNNGDEFKGSDKVFKISSEKFSTVDIDKYKTVFSEKYISLRRIFPAQRNLLLNSNFELMFNRDKYKTIESMVLDIQHLHDLFGALEFLVIQADATGSISNLLVSTNIKEHVKLLFQDLEHSSLLLSRFPIEKDNIGRVSRPSSYQQLDNNQDHSIELMNSLTNNVNNVASDYNLTVLEHHQLNATLFVMYRFIYHYKLIYNKLVDHKEFIVHQDKLYTLNNNNFRSNGQVNENENELKII